MFDYNQRPPSKEFSKGYEGIKWDKEDVVVMPIVEMSKDEFGKLYPEIKESDK